MCRAVSMAKAIDVQATAVLGLHLTCLCTLYVLLWCVMATMSFLTKFWRLWHMFVNAK